MEPTGGTSGSTLTAVSMPSPSVAADNCKGSNYEFDPSISEEEKKFYLKAYPTVDVVRERKTHCTVCKIHIGTAPVQENGIKMHPILRVTHCNKCHDFYNSGEFSKGEDGSELYCRWCGQGGEVYCCSSCPYVFCKSCIVKNLSKGVVADIEQNENWNCFSCAPKILWPLRAQHWALMNYIEQQKKELYALNLSESELKINLGKDRSKCCRLAKAKCGNMSDSMESLDSIGSKRSHSSVFSNKKPLKHSLTPSPQHMNSKRGKTNDEVVCTPDLLSMLEPDCQITVSQKQNRPLVTPSASTPKIMSIQQTQSNYAQMHPNTKSSAPPPLVLRNTAIKIRPAVTPPVVRRTIIGPRTPAPGGNGTPVYHTINGYRIDLNSAAQQETFRLPNGKLIQVKRQGPPAASNNSPAVNNWQQMSNSQQQQRLVPQTIASRPVQITQHPYSISMQPQGPPVVRYHNNIVGSAAINPVPHNGTTIQVVNGQISAGPQLQPQQQQQQQQIQQSGPIRPVMVRHVFPDSAVGNARNGLQDQVFNAMEICTHLTNKVQTLTNSNAYKQARSFLEVKELYIHLSYLLTYAIGRFKSLQDKCLGDMRTLGFGNDADCLENGQLAAAVDYVCYGQLDDVDLFNSGANSFHNQVYEYRKSLHANLKEGEDGAKSPLPPIFSLSQGKSEDAEDDVEGEDSLLEEPKGLKGHWLEGGDESPIPSSYNQENEENEEPDESYLDNDDDDVYNRSSLRGSFNDSLMQGTEESMKKNEETYIYDRKLTRLVSQYPSIWCTRHPDYGNFEVTRKQWRTIASHFGGKEHIKLRWKNIRKRFVRIEKRIAEGKRFNGHFDKAMAFLANRDLPEDQWVPVDCGEDDGDTFSRCNLDAIEQSLHLQGKDDLVDRTKEIESRSSFSMTAAVKPIEVDSLDSKIISFVKTNPVLWRKSMDAEADKIDEETRRTVWKQLQRNLTNVTVDEIKNRWQHLYEMYKTFRLKTIKSIEARSNLELKYSKYLAKLYFLYKIDEDELRNENSGLFEDCFELDGDVDVDTEEADSDEESRKRPHVKIQDMPDDKEFLLQLVKLVRQYPAIWDGHHQYHNDIMIRDNYWQEINKKLQNFKRNVKSLKLRWQLAKYSFYRFQREKDKQASDDEDNEIEIVEPKTDLITLDSDDDEPNAQAKTQNSFSQLKSHLTNSSPKHSTDLKIKQGQSPVPLPQVNTSGAATPPTRTANSALPMEDNMDLMSMAQSFLASMLEIEIQEGTSNSPGLDSSGQKKQPRKKLTSKPNPTLLKQKALMELERLEEIKRSDQKLKMKCSVELKKAEEEFPYAKDMLEARTKDKTQIEIDEENENDQLLIEKDDNGQSVAETIEKPKTINGSTKGTNDTADNDSREAFDVNAENSLEVAGDTVINIAKTDNPVDTTKIDTSADIILEKSDNSLEDAERSEKDEKKADNHEVEDVKSTEVQSQSSDIEEIKINGVTDDIKVTKEMEAVESPTINATTDNSIKNDHKESPKIIFTETEKLESNNSISNVSVLDEKTVENNVEDFKQSMEIEERPVNSKLENLVPSLRTTDADHEVAKSTLDIEDSTKLEKTEFNKIDVPVTVAEVTKALPAVVEEECLPSDAPSSEKPLTDLNESNGNV